MKFAAAERGTSRVWVMAGARLLVAVVVVLLCLGKPTAAVATGSPGWAIKAVAIPTVFSSGERSECATSPHCDRYTVVVTNVGRAPSSGPIVVTDVLPVGASPVASVRVHDLRFESEHECPPPLGLTVTCTYEESLPPGESLVMTIPVLTEASGEPLSLEDVARVEGGGASGAASAVVHNLGDAPAPSNLDVVDFSMGVYGPAGEIDQQAGSHPDTVTTGFDLSSELVPGMSSSYVSVAEAKTLTIELPLGLVGDPLSTAEMCPEANLPTKPEAASQGFTSSCPPDSRIGTVVLNRETGFESSQRIEPDTDAVSGLYNMVPEAGYPFVFGFRFISTPILLYGRIVPTPNGYKVRMTAPNLPHGGDFKVVGALLSLFGVPNAENGLAGAEPRPLLRNPTSCSSPPEQLSARIEVSSWVRPEEAVSRQAPVYSTGGGPPEIVGCNLLQYAPGLEVKPDETTKADSPSGYEIRLTAPQPSLFEERATPDLKGATVALPEGVTLSPSFANGLEGCDESQIDPLGTELGEGHPGGNESPYDDGVEHAIPGHCPDASKIGTVEIRTPLLSEPLKGFIYAAQPSCGGVGQHECGQASATDGELYGLYLEVSGSGVTLKLHGKVAADASTGRLTATFEENPQLPFEELRLTFDSGDRAPLANPQTCGTAIATSDLEPWSAPESGPNAKPTSAVGFTGCVQPAGLAPGFTAGVGSPLAGAFTPFAMSLTRRDGEQDFGGVTVTLPAGLSAMVSSVTLCGEADANAGACPPDSRIGTVHVAAGAGSEPLWLEGPVYFTGPYEGAPFGLSMVIPAKMGPFDLGEEVVRATVTVDPYTTQIVTKTEPLRLIRDGIPFRLKAIQLVIDRPGFVFNPTSCAKRQVAASVSGRLPGDGEESVANVSTPFALTGCNGLSFKPTFSVATSSKHTRAGGAGMHVSVVSPPGQANVGAVHVEIPKILPSRLTTLNQACTEAQFAANPAGCPPGSIVGLATAQTPILSVPIVGPAIFVSHGGAAFPNLDFVLQGEGVTLILVGDTFIDKSGVTSSTFSSIPDLPVRRFDLDLPAGPHSALSASGDLCAEPLLMPTTITAQNGAQVKQRTKVAVEGCKPQVRVLRRSVRRHVARILVRVPSAGTLTASAAGLSRAVKRVGKAGIFALTLRLARAERRFLARHPGRRLRARVLMRFTPTHGRPLGTRLALLVG